MNDVGIVIGTWHVHKNFASRFDHVTRERARDANFDWEASFILLLLQACLLRRAIELVENACTRI